MPISNFEVAAEAYFNRSQQQRLIQRLIKRAGTDKQPKSLKTSMRPYAQGSKGVKVASPGETITYDIDGKKVVATGASSLRALAATNVVTASTAITDPMIYSPKLVM
jgi:hypothetical protein